ncbi:unnamed protein product [Diabrotica balteata]|uniref:Thioesterase domain-containing protein n=1 Tax=Diabrotica balteata TaxID=107213 RepID=A0A9N9SUT3_DIABA|nr:unnamed protein product [Diabrotica balteata]
MCKFELKHLVTMLKETKAFEQCLKTLNIVSMGNGKCIAELKVLEEHTNPMGTLHGGLSATLVDSVSSYGLFTHEKGGVKSVSVNINVSYMGGAKLGEEIVIESDTIKVGKTLAFCEVLIKNKANGNVLVKGEHTKYLMR